MMYILFMYLPCLVDGATSGCSLNYGQDRSRIPWCVAFNTMCFRRGEQKSILFGEGSTNMFGTMTSSRFFTLDLNMIDFTSFVFSYC